jgi:hypothetical protein
MAWFYVTLRFAKLPPRPCECCAVRLAAGASGCRESGRHDAGVAARPRSLPEDRPLSEAHSARQIDFGKTISGENSNEINARMPFPLRGAKVVAAEHAVLLLLPVLTRSYGEKVGMRGPQRGPDSREIPHPDPATPRLRNSADTATFRIEAPPSAKQTWEGLSWMSALLLAFS